MVPSSRPVLGFVFGLVGGILILVGGAIFSALSGFFLGLFGILGLVFGILVLLGSIMLYAAPRQHVAWGVIVLVFSVASIVGLGGFIIGMVLGIVGGALGIAWNPHGGVPSESFMMGPYGVPVMPWRMCMGCGRWIPWAYNVCPLCGTSAPVAPWVPKAWPGPADAPVAAPAPAAMPTAPPAASMAAPAQPPPENPVKAPCPTCDGEAEWMPGCRNTEWHVG